MLARTKMCGRSCAINDLCALQLQSPEHEICKVQVAIEQLQSELEAAQRGEDEAREAATKVIL